MERTLRRGRVVDAHGAGIGGARVAVVWGTAPTPEIGRRTAPDGAFSVALPAGVFRLEAVTEAGQAGEIEVQGAAGDDIVIRVAPTPPNRGGR